jgi:transposase
VKTDRRDAQALCEACRLGAYRPAHRASDRSRHRRGLIAAREALVQTRTRYISVVRALLRREGHRIRSGGAPTFVERVKELELPAYLKLEVAPLLTLMKSINVQLEKLDRRLAKIVKGDEVVQRLTTVPGIGPVTAVTLVATLDRVERFDNAGQVRCYLGVVPREYSSGERAMRGRITKAGNRRLRSLRVEAAWSILRFERESTKPLREWALRIASRRGKRIAAVALARKLAGIVYAMWRDDTTFGQPASRRRQLAARTTHPEQEQEQEYNSPSRRDRSARVDERDVPTGLRREPWVRWRRPTDPNPTMRRGSRRPSRARTEG